MVSRKILGGSLYGKELLITTVLDQYSFEASLDGGSIISDLRERDLETVLPSSS